MSLMSYAQSSINNVIEAFDVMWSMTSVVLRSLL